MRHRLEVAPAAATQQAPDRHVEVTPGPVEQRHVEARQRLPIGQSVARTHRRPRHRLAQTQPIERVLAEQLPRHALDALQHFVRAVGLAEAARAIGGFQLDDDALGGAAHVHRADVELPHRHRHAVQRDAGDRRLALRAIDHDVAWPSRDRPRRPAAASRRAASKRAPRQARHPRAPPARVRRRSAPRRSTTCVRRPARRHAPDRSAGPARRHRASHARDRAARADAPTPPAAARRGRTRDTPLQDRHRDRRCRPASAVVRRRAASPARWAAPVHRGAMPARQPVPLCRLPHQASRPAAQRRSPRWSVPRAARPPAHLSRHRAAAWPQATRADAPHRQARCSAARRGRDTPHPAGRTRPGQPPRAPQHSARACGRTIPRPRLKDRPVRSRNRWQPPCRPGWWWTASDRRSACRLPRGSLSPSTSRRDRRRATPDW